MAGKPTHFVARGEFPQAHRSVPAARQDIVAVGLDCDGDDLVSVPGEAAYWSVGLSIPQVSHAIRLTCQDILAVRRKRHSIDLTWLSIYRSQLAAYLGIPKPGGPVSAAGKHIFAVRRKGNTGYFVDVGRECTCQVS